MSSLGRDSSPEKLLECLIPSEDGRGGRVCEVVLERDLVTRWPFLGKDVMIVGECVDGETKETVFEQSK